MYSAERLLKVLQNFQGLEDGDQIIQFGTLHSGNFSDINQFTDVVRKSVNVSSFVCLLWPLNGNFNLDSDLLI